MLHILLLIIKIIGILFLAILGLLISIILMVLFVPLRYRAEVIHGDIFFAEGTLSWLMHILHAKIRYKDSKFHIRIRIFGIILFDNLRQRTSKTRSKSRKSKFPVRKKSNTPDKKYSQSEEADILNSKKNDYNLEIENENEMSPENIKKDTLTEEFRTGQKSDEKLEGDSFIKRLLQKFKRMKDKIVSFFKRIKERIKKWTDSFLNIKNKIHLVSDFIKNELNQEAFKLTYSSLKKLLKHILPTKLKSNIVFGTGDPCSTGQVLGILGILYSFYGDNIQITPDFENKRLEGKHYAKGRIRLVTLLIIAIKLIMDKRFKQLKRNMKILKEAL